MRIGWEQGRSQILEPIVLRVTLSFTRYIDAEQKPEVEWLSSVKGDCYATGDNLRSTDAYIASGHEISDQRKQEQEG